MFYYIFRYETFSETSSNSINLTLTRFIWTRKICDQKSEIRDKHIKSICNWNVLYYIFLFHTSISFLISKMSLALFYFILTVIDWWNSCTFFTGFAAKVVLIFHSLLIFILATIFSLKIIPIWRSLNTRNIIIIS